MIKERMLVVRVDPLGRPTYALLDNALGFLIVSSSLRDYDQSVRGVFR